MCCICNTFTLMKHLLKRSYSEESEGRKLSKLYEEGD